jgi:SPP1 gp7 family putative phage head morphogenesis protein
MAEELDPEFLERLATGAVVETSEFNKAEMTRQLRAAVGVDIFLADPGLLDLVRGFVANNVALIRTIPHQLFEQVEEIVRDGIRKGRRASAIAPTIAERFGVSRRRAQFIARDQIAKANGQLTQIRQTELGIQSYIWRTSRDERVRESHRELEGTEHRWDDPPTTSEGRTVHPGEDFQCRCTAEPVIPGVETIKTSPKDVPRDPELVRRWQRRRRRQLDMATAARARRLYLADVAAMVS